MSSVTCPLMGRACVEDDCPMWIQNKGCSIALKIKQDVEGY